MRTLLIELRPSALGEQTLGQLLELLADSARARSGTTITLQVEGDHPLSNNVTLIFYRIAQESLNNIAKHAEATEVNLWLNSDGEDVSLQIADDGRGFDPTNIPPGHLGISIMQERAREIGAAIQIDSNPGDGTLIKVTWSKKEQTV
jgi:signal transduction histidine kinase